MNKRNRKGITLIELLIILSLIAVVSPLIFSALLYGMNTYNTYTNYLEQQNKVSDVLQYLRKDIEEASAYRIEVDALSNKITLGFPDGRPEKCWKFEGEKLLLADNTMVEELEATSVGFVLPLTGASPSRFAFDSNQKRLIVIIQPQKTNKGWFEGRNVNTPITAEFSVKYKKVL